MDNLTLDELIQSLQSIKRSRSLTGDEFVVVGSNYGDRNNTIQAVFTSEVETGTLQDTCYSESGYKILGDEPEEGEEQVVILNYDIF